MTSLADTQVAPHVSRSPRLSSTEMGPDGTSGLPVKSLLLAAVASIAIWWASTAILIFFNFIPSARPFVFIFSLAMASASVYWLLKNKHNETVGGAYMAFTTGLLLWAFVESSFYTGYIVGIDPNVTEPVPPSWTSFTLAVQSSIFHELLVLALGLSALYLMRDATNRFGLYIFLIFWFFHQSAKLNVFFGVTNTGSDFLPETVAGLQPFMHTQPMNFLFPFSVTINTIVGWHLLRRGFAKNEVPWRQVGYVLVGTMAALAAAEHWFLVLPLEGTLWDISLHGH
jgi:putative photosynthetic complex assembly protein 2